MMKKPLSIMVFIMIILSSCGEPAAPQPIATQAPIPFTETPTPKPTLVPSPANTPFPAKVTEFVHGISLGSQGDDIFFTEHLKEELEFLSTINVDTVRINTQWFMPEPGSAEIRMLPAQGALSDDGIRFFANSVYNSGMDSWLALHLYYDNWTGWAGGHQATNWDEWEKSYTDYVLYYATLSESLGIDYLSIMNELQTAVVREEFVVELINAVRNVYSGKIVINIDSCPGDYHSLVPPSVVAESDIIGLQLYPGPRTSQGATVEEMTKALIPYFNRVADHFAPLEYKSLVISEFGITRLDGSTSKQCTWIWPETKQEDLKEMADYYQAFSSALEQSRLRPMIDGVVLHEWKVKEQILKGDYLEEGAWGEFVPRDNSLALDIIANWYASLRNQP